MLSVYLRLGLPSGLFPSGFPTNNLYTFLFSPFVPLDTPVPFNVFCFRTRKLSFPSILRPTKLSLCDPIVACTCCKVIPTSGSRVAHPKSGHD
jgi:hypothetical protein